MFYEISWREQNDYFKEYLKSVFGKKIGGNLIGNLVLFQFYKVVKDGFS